MKKLNFYLGFVIIIITFISTLYISLYWGLIEPILTVCKAIDTNSFTIVLIGENVIKFIIREVLAGFILIIGWSIGTLVIQNK